MSTPTSSDFAVKTKAELLRLGAEAERTRPGHNCPEKAQCRICHAYRALHAQIDDHLTQLFDEPQPLTVTFKQTEARPHPAQPEAAAESQQPDET